MSPASIIPAAGDASARGIRFAGPRGGLVWLLIGNFFLNLITLGIFRFWARTRLRAYFWRNVSIEGEQLEYVGRGAELFIGFLIVFGVLMSVGIPYTALQFLFLSFDPVVQTIVEVAYYVVLFVLIQIAIFRARRYRLTRTVWRGIRCGLDGNSGRYALASCLYMIPVIGTLGFAHPWRRVALQSYLMNNTRFGRQHFSFHGAGRDLFPYWAVTALAWWTLAVCLVYFNYDIVQAIQDFYERAVAGENIERFSLPDGTVAWWPFLILPVALSLRLWYGVVEFRYFTAQLRFGDVEFSSALGVRHVAGYIAIYLLLILVGIAATIAVIAGLIALSTFGGAGDLGKAFSPVLAILGFFLLFGILNIVRVGWLYYEILRVICRTLTATSLESVDRVVREADDGVRRGEGLADVLDFGDI